MIKVSTLGIAGGTLLLAAGAGLYMQMTGGTSDDPQVAAIQVAPPVEMPEVKTAEIIKLPETDTSGGVDMASATLVSSELPMAPAAAVDPDLVDVVVSSLAPFEPAAPMAPMMASIQPDDLPMEMPAEPSAGPTDVVPLKKDCVVDLIGETRAAAMVALSLSAPCYPAAQVEFRHEGMIFSGMTDANGMLEVVVPALSESASFLALLDNGNGAAVDLDVDTLSFYDRSVVQWQGDASVELHAMEFGAGWGDEGHVWTESPRDASFAARGEGGFLTRLGDPDILNGNMAEVYTFPTGTARKGGEVELSVEVEVTQANCGRDLSAEIIEVDGAMAGKAGELTLSVPGCDAVGDFIQLKNLVSDLKIAAR